MRTGTLLLMLLLLTAGCGVSVDELEEVAELLEEGGEVELRDPLRPVRGTTRMLVLALDGVGANELREALEAGRMPELRALLGPRQDTDAGTAGGQASVYGHAYARWDVLSVLPSATGAAWASIYTGAAPAQTGVPGNEWWVREERRFLAPVPVTVGPEHLLEAYADHLVAERLRASTVFERLPLRSHVSMVAAHAGADVLTYPDLTGFGDLFAAAVESAVEGGDPDVYRETDEAAVGRLLNAIRDRALPDLQVAYFPGIDLYTHNVRQPLPQQKDYLAEVVDPAIGRMLRLYRERGVLDSTYVLLLSDHGHTPVLADDRHSLYVDGDDEPPAVLEHAGWRVRPHAIETEAEDFQAVFAYQGGLAYVYLADRATCAAPGARCDWDRAPRLQQDVIAAARAFHAASERGEGVPALRGTLELILARATSGARGEAPPFQVFDGERLVPIDDYLEARPHPHLLRLRERLEQLAVGPYGHYAGDLLLVPRFGTARPIGERFYFNRPYHSEHGSAYAEDSLVPLIVAAPGRTGEELRGSVQAVLGSPASQLDYAALIEHLLR